MSDGRIGTVVFNGLSGVGVKWGEHAVDEAIFAGTSGDCLPPSDGSPALAESWPFSPDAMLREPYPSAVLPCVGENFEIVGNP